MKCAVVECHKPRACDLVLDVNPEFDRSRPTPFCAEHLIEFDESQEAKQPNRGAADFVERRWKETCYGDSVTRGRAHQEREAEQNRAAGKK